MTTLFSASTHAPFQQRNRLEGDRLDLRFIRDAVKKDMQRTRILFMGSDELACPALERLCAEALCAVVAVVAQPDRPKGRGRRLAPCPAKACAGQLGVPVLTPERIGSPEAMQAVAGFEPDLIVVAAYGQYIRPKMLALPALGAINIHPSLLPKYRGASPIQWALANGDTETGVTILHVSEEMDAGDIILQRAFPIEPDDTAPTLAARLAVAGADLLWEAVLALRAGTAPRIPQDSARATLTHKLHKEDGRIDWQWPATTIRNRIRGFQPWPGCFTTFHGEPLKLWEAEVVTGPATAKPGTLVRFTAHGPVIATGQEQLCLVTVQPAGKKAMSAAAWLRGHPVPPGTVLGADGESGGVARGG